MRTLSGIISCLQPKKVLDVGAGTGFLSNILSEMGLDVTGVDLSRGMLTQAKEGMRVQRSNGNPSPVPDHQDKRRNVYNLCQGDAEGLPFQSSSFDLVVSRHLLWTLPHPARAVAEWKRILRPGGMMIAIDGNWFDPAISKKIGREISGLLAGFSRDHNPVPFRQIYKPIEKDLPLFQASRPDQCLALFMGAGLEKAKVDRLDEVNRFYKKNTSLSFRMANSDTVFMVFGERGESEN